MFASVIVTIKNELMNSLYCRHFLYNLYLIFYFRVITKSNESAVTNSLGSWDHLSFVLGWGNPTECFS